MSAAKHSTDPPPWTLTWEYIKTTNHTSVRYVQFYILIYNVLTWTYFEWTCPANILTSIPWIILNGLVVLRLAYIQTIRDSSRAIRSNHYGNVSSQMQGKQLFRDTHSWLSIFCFRFVEKDSIRKETTKTIAWHTPQKNSTNVLFATKPSIRWIFSSLWIHTKIDKPHKHNPHQNQNISCNDISLSMNIWSV